MQELQKRISQNTASFSVGNIGARIVAGMLLGVVVVAVLATPIAAIAEGDMTSNDIVIPDSSCHERWRWQEGYYSINSIPYTQVKWTANSCGYLIRDRTECQLFLGNKYDTAPGGTVKAVNLKSRTYCHNSTDALIRGEYQWKRPGANWSAWKTFWKGSN